MIDRALEDESIPSVVLNNYRAGELAAEHFIGLGHTQIACITGPLNIALCRERVKGFTDVLLNHQLEFDDAHIFEGDFKLESGLKGAAFFRRQSPKISAIWAHNDVMAAGVIKELYKQGVRVPQEMSVMGMDDISLATMMTPALTTIRQPFQAMSEHALELILLQKQGQVLLQRAVVLEPELIVRETTEAM